MKKVLLAASLFAEGFTLKRSEVAEQLTNEQVYSGFGCSGENLSPSLAWEHAPKETKSFTVTVYDPDVPTGSGWWHRVVFNLPATVTLLPKGAGNPATELMPKGSVQSMTSYGRRGRRCRTPGAGQSGPTGAGRLHAQRPCDPKSIADRLLRALGVCRINTQGASGCRLRGQGTQTARRTSGLRPGNVRRW